jgi:3-dehydroquinate synthase
MIRSALIPAADRGARLDRPGTPKPLVDIQGEAMIVRLARQLARAGIERLVVVVGFRGKQVARALEGHADLGLALTIIHNPRWKEGLAGSILAAESAFHEPFVLAMADHVFDERLVRLMVEEEPPPGGLSVLVDRRLEEFKGDSAVTVRLDGDRVVDIGRNLRPCDAVDAGLFSATPQLFTALAGAARSGSGELYEGVKVLASAQRVRAVPLDGGRWYDVDLPADLVRAEMYLREQRREALVTQKPARCAPAATRRSGEFELVTGGLATTRVVVERGIVSSPESLELVPDRSASSPIFVFTDDTVNRLYGERFVGKLRAQGYDVHAIVLPDGEEAKTLSSYVYLVERVLARGVDERSVFISLGGGVVCNVCGFVASTIYRGLDLVHVPTTVMSQCDAAVSHKQAINGPRGKNMIGSYFPPRLVAIDVDVLETLPPRLVRDGLAEAIKHAIAQDPAYARMLLSFDGSPSDPDFLEEVVRRNVALKSELVRVDPKEHREGVVLQYGHTFGHPVEHASGYRLFHGESVAIGMMVAARVARLLGACGDDLVQLHEHLIGHFDLPTRAPASIRTEDVLDSLRFNKKYLVEGTRMALLEGVGKVWSVSDEHIIPVSERVLADAFEATRGGPDPWAN